MKKQITLTLEQAAIKEYRGRRLRIRAFAGAAKTTTLAEYAEANPSERILYVAYNRAIRDEAASKFPKGVDCKTAHQLAYHSIGRSYSGKLAQNLRLTDIANAVDTRNWTAVKDIQETLTNYLNSADLDIGEQHFNRVEAGTELSGKKAQYRSSVVAGASMLWQRMIDLNDKEVKNTHDGYFKLWQTSLPELSSRYTTILVDEGQDLNACLIDVIFRQKAKVIICGDSHQQIYRFRGAVNALDHSAMDGVDEMYLTSSFRFGPAVAHTANIILSYKGEELEIIGAGPATKVTRKLPDDIDHHAVLHRTVMGVIENALMLAAQEHKIFWVGGLEAYKFSELEDLYRFSKGENSEIRRRQLLEEYRDFQEYRVIAEESNDREMERSVKLIDTYDDLLERLAELRKCSVKEEFDATVTLTTAHKAKGLEWDAVKLYEDFADPLDPKMEPEERDDELNLLYVAVTRAMKILALNTVVIGLMASFVEKRNRQIEHASQALATHS